MLIKDGKVDKLCGSNMVGIIKAVTSMKNNFEFLNLRIADGKDYWVRNAKKKILMICRIIDDIFIEVFRYDLNMEYERVINET